MASFLWHPVDEREVITA